MLLRTFYDESLAQTSYLLGCQATGEALVIDPHRSIDQYIALARSKGLRITKVTETHIHADFVSGSRELASKTGAQLYLSDMGPVEWKYSYAAEAGAVLLRDKETFQVGNILVQALHTPGHTPEHLSFLITDNGAHEPIGIFTGDFIFVGDVGRPDLLERAAGIQGTMEQGARQLFRSLQMMYDFPEYLQIWPGHGAGSACGRALSAIPQTTLGYEQRFNWAFSINDEEAFVQAVLAGQPEPPFYFAEMKRMNKVGPPLLNTQPFPQLQTLEQVQVQLAAQVKVIDTRAANAYAAGHIPGTINIPLNGSFLTWAGWLLSYDRPFVLIADQQEAIEARRILSLIGLDTITGYLPVSIIQQWQEKGQAVKRLQALDVHSLHRRLEQEHLPVIDVRAASEYAAGHVHGAINIPLGELEQRLHEVPVQQAFVVHCQAGSRSAIAASILAAHGFSQHIDMTGGFAAWKMAGLPVEKKQLIETR
ncbi:MBL fold metallo-hydrolase [Tengunoibacter tsumagoiensis]|uniref:MBL fold hydrolase n=1 Tax=Tengunoibacter tsumagoiensis TaxID=2014871 RepID=A0A402A8G1_9CHLR|nr:MBL fold metallo-hydrolase [Tengunoibacter tsumagoiensis]GCE15251.1 MBL fold hydrolase [Tengunoibacter tsumagoiensis]